jgi:hypothetical protein
MDDGNITQHKKTFPLVPRPAGELEFAGFIISDRDQCDISFSIGTS